MKKVFVLFTVVMLMAGKAWEKENGEGGKGGVLFNRVEKYGAGEARW